MIGAKWADLNARTREALLLATVRPILAELEPGETMATRELFERVADPELAHAGGVYRGLTQLAKRHPEIATRGAPEAGRGLMRGKTVRPWLWHRPEERAEVKRCPHCGGAL